MLYSVECDDATLLLSTKLMHLIVRYNLPVQQRKRNQYIRVKWKNKCDNSCIVIMYVSVI